MKRLRHWGRCIRGDYLTAQGKRLVILGALAPVWVANLVLGGAWAYAVLALLSGWFMALWVSTETGCEDEDRQIYCSPSNEAELAVCHGCEAWMLRIRGDERGQGRGAESLIKRLRELARSHERDLPVVAGELALLADGVEETGNLEEDPKLIEGTDKRNLPTEAEASDQMEKIIDSVTKGVSEGKTIGEALSQAGTFVGDSSEGLGMGIIVDGDQYKRFTEFIESQGEEVKAFGRVEARAIGRPPSQEPKEKQPEPTPENCQDCGQKLGDEHLKTCPYSKEGTVTEQHTKASSAK